MAVGEEGGAGPRVIWRFFPEPSWELNPFLTGRQRKAATGETSCESQEGPSLGLVSFSFFIAVCRVSLLLLLFCLSGSAGSVHIFCTEHSP